MSDMEIKEKSIKMIEDLVKLPYSEIFQISPIQRDLLNMHMQAPQLIEPLIGLTFCSIMLGYSNQARDYVNKAWNIGGQLPDMLEMFYTDCLLNLKEFEKAKLILQDKMADPEKNLRGFFNVVAKYSLYTGELYILDNISQDEDIYLTEPALFNFAKKYSSGLNNKHYHTVLNIIYEVLGEKLCVLEYMNHDSGIQMCLYTSLNAEENIKAQRIILEKINGYYLSMQEQYEQDVFIRLENVNLHPAWW